MLVRAWRTAFKLEGGLASTLRSLGSYCSSPERSIDSLMGFYKELVSAIMNRYSEEVSTPLTKGKSFHLPLIRSRDPLEGIGGLYRCCG